MSRRARQKSETGIYHILLRSAANDVFFRAPEDYKKFTDILKKNKDECGYKLYAYILLENEIRLLIKVGNIGLDIIFKRLCVKYSYWYNCKYKRRGGLFFDRFKSEPVNTDFDFDNVYRYIVKLPEKFNMKYDEYLYGSLSEFSIADKYKKYDKNFFEVQDNNEYLAVKEAKLHLTDEYAIQKILQITNSKDMREAKEIDYSKEQEYIKTMIAEGIGYRQLNRLIGVNYFAAKKAADGRYQPAGDKKKTVDTKNVNKETEQEIIDFFLL